MPDIILKDYCITYIPQTPNMDVKEKLANIKQSFLKLTEESAEKIKKLFEDSAEFLIEEFKINED